MRLPMEDPGRLKETALQWHNLLLGAGRQSIRFRPCRPTTSA